jgi:hypothetical protein
MEEELTGEWKNTKRGTLYFAFFTYIKKNEMVEIRRTHEENTNKILVLRTSRGGSTWETGMIGE